MGKNYPWKEVRRMRMRGLSKVRDVGEILYWWKQVPVFTMQYRIAIKILKRKAPWLFSMPRPERR